MHNIETERLLLRGLEETDMAALQGMLASPSVMAWLFQGAPMNPADARRFIERNFTFGPSATGIGVVEEKETGRFIGFAGLLPCQYLGAEDFEIGAAFMEDSWHRGYGVEIGSAQISCGIGTLHLPRLLALAHPDNVNSLKVLEKLGMRFVKEIPTEARGPRRIYAITGAEK
ncbi:MAG TPA: GNAT family N-acetyltransferase [Syntrophorhabdaceae bacterium]|jgi:RimJ/RimL family protein N-acetyltransferase